MKTTNTTQPNTNADIIALAAELDALGYNVDLEDNYGDKVITASLDAYKGILQVEPGSCPTVTTYTFSPLTETVKNFANVDAALVAIALT